MNRSSLILVYGTFLSLALLVVLFIIQHYCPQLLDIDAKWLGLALVPIILVLMIGGYVRKFSGWGIDIEVIGNEPLFRHESIITLLQPLSSVAKGYIDELADLTEEEKRSKDTLVFYQHKAYDYNEQAIQIYLQELHNIKYFLVLDDQNRFKYIIRYRPSSEVDNFNFIMRFLNHLRQEDTPLPRTYTEIVYKEERIIDVYEKLESGPPFIVVVNREKTTQGIVMKSRMERYLARQVLYANKRSE